MEIFIAIFYFKTNITFTKKNDIERKHAARLRTEQQSGVVRRSADMFVWKSVHVLTQCCFFCFG